MVHDKRCMAFFHIPVSIRKVLKEGLLDPKVAHIPDHLSHLVATISSICFDKSVVWVYHKAPAYDFISIVLIRTLPGALSRLILA